MDYISQILKVQYNCAYGMMPPSYLYQLDISNSVGNFHKVPSGVDAVQIHFVRNHYMVSVQINKQIYVYDSLLNSAHLEAVKSQLRLVYERMNSEPILLCPQSQGSTILCGFFAIANTQTLLQKRDPSNILFKTSEMRCHLHKCLIAGKIDAFPSTLRTQKHPVDLIKAYMKDQASKQSLKNKQKHNDNIHVLTRKERLAALRRNQRQNKAYKDKEKKRETENRRKKRKTESYKEKEVRRETLERKRKRLDKVYKDTERKREKSDRKRKRLDKVYKDTERERDKSDRKRKRLDKVYRDTERERDKCDRKRKRLDKGYISVERRRETLQRKRKRLDKIYRDTQRERDKSDRKRKRLDKVYISAERRRETLQRKRKRLDKIYRDTEKERDKSDRKRKRLDKVYKDTERERDRSDRKRKRLGKVYKSTERQRETLERKRKRLDKVYKDIERKRESEYRRNKRTNEYYREKERMKELVYRRKLRQTLGSRRLYRHRQNKLLMKIGSHKRQIKTSKDTEKEKGKLSVQGVIDKFHRIVSKGPSYTCVACNQLWYRHSVVSMNGLSASNVSERVQDVLKKCVNSVDNQKGLNFLCKTCVSHIKKGKIPPCAKNNGMKFPEQGPLKEMNMLELSLLAPVLPFMRIYKAPQGQQMKIQGNMVLVPADVKNSVTVLPRLPSDTATIKAKLKRRLRYRSHIYSLNIRPEKIRQGLIFLSETSHLFKEHNIAFDYEIVNQLAGESTAGMNQVSAENSLNEQSSENSSETLNEEELQTHRNDQNDQSALLKNVTGDSYENGNNEYQNEAAKNKPGIIENKEGDNDNDSDNWSEADELQEEQQVNPGVLDTMLTAPDFVESAERDFVFSFAPAEGHTPLSVFLEKNSEELAFPGIFCGQTRRINKEREVPVTYSEIVRSELRNSDRRVASCVENIFFKTKKLQMKQLIDQTQIVMRKCKTKGKSLTAKDVKGEGAKEYVHTDKAYKFMKSLRGSPPYFQAVSKDLFAVIRQLGPATFFMSLSAAETRWAHLLKILSQIIDNKVLSEEEATNLTWQEKSRLIQSDPVTCARHFDFCVNKFITEFLSSKSAPLGKMQDYFYRVEYQQRGSPHVHMMIWCENSPRYGVDSKQEVIRFIDTHITCQKTDETPENKELIKYQTHRHSHTCRKKKRKQCRFGFPKPPMRLTDILEPLDADIDPTEEKIHKKNWTKIQGHLKDMAIDEDIIFDSFLKDLGMSEDQYVLAVRSSITSATVFLKRSPSEIRVNNYNPHCLKAWRANMDLQYVLDVYACASYIAAYVTKAQRGMSELLRKACTEAKNGNKDIREQVRTIGNKFLNAVEISAQEAVYICLGLPMRKSSKQVIFINTSPPDERVVLLKPHSVIENMRDDCEDIECSNLISRYCERTGDLEDVTLAEYAAYYDSSKKGFTSRSKSCIKTTLENLVPESQCSDNDDSIEPTEKDESTASKKSVSKGLKRRQTPRIIRYVHFNPDTDSEKFYRELIMLFYPWRDEHKDLLAGSETYKKRYELIHEAIEEERLIYEPFRDAVDSAEQIVENIENEFDEAWENLAPNTEHMESTDIPQGSSNENEQEHYDIGMDLGLNVTRQEEEMNLVYEIPDNEYREHMRSLTKEQIAFVYDVINQLKTGSEPIYRFLSGGAGVGKSHVTKAIHQMAVKYYNKQAGEDFGQVKVLVLAPTGKAAYHVRGNTIHTGLRIAANRKLQHRPLNTNSLNTFRNQLGQVSLVIIDEISMVGFRMLNCIHQRLLELTQSKEDFGGLSVLVVGDLFQLPPVHDCYSFLTPDVDYLPLSTNLWLDHFTMYELKEIMRQRESKDFAELLNRLREGVHTDEDINVLTSRVIDPFSSDYPHNAVHLFTNNDRVDAHNELTLKSSSDDIYEVRAKDRIVNSISEEAKSKVLKSFLTSKKKDKQLPTVLELAEGFSYDLTINVDTQDGLTNGASCTIMKIELPSKKCQPGGPVWVQFEHPDVGIQTRARYKHLYKPGIDPSWTPIMPVSRQFAAGHKGQVQVQRFQYPLRPAKAKSIHRAQGCTTDEAVVNLSVSERQRGPIHHMHYVAFSRVKTLDGLYITDLNLKKLSTSETVKQEMDRLRKSAPELSLQFLYNMVGVFRVAFLNARSLHRHLLDANRDFNLQAAEIICFCETRFCHKDSHESTLMPGFYQYRQDSNLPVAQNQRPSYGMVIYSRDKLLQNPRNLSVENIEIMFSCLNYSGKTVNLVTVYSPPKTPSQRLLGVLSDIHTQYLSNTDSVIMGDFNIDWTSDSQSSKFFVQELSKLGYHQLITQPTCDTGSVIDLVLVNFRDDCSYRAGTLPVYYSDHSIIWLAL